MKTIPKNHTRKIELIKAKAVRCKVFSERNNFVRKDCEPSYAWKELYEYPFAKLIEYEDKWTIDVHSNLWYELREAE